ncbi:unnamed protein product [Bathycoccus prasinos]
MTTTVERRHLEALSYLFDEACFGGGGKDGTITNRPVLPVLGKFLMTRNLTLSSSSSSGGGEGGSTTKTNESSVLRAVLKDAKEIVGQIRKKRDEWSFARANFASDFTANYRRKIGHPLLAKLPSSSRESKIIKLCRKCTSSSSIQVCVISVLVYFARQTATAKRRRHRQRKERVKRSILKRMSKCETYAKYVTLEEELEQFEEDEEENIAITYCSSDKRGLKGGKFGNSLNGLFRLSHSSHNGTNTKESHHREDQQTKSSSFDQKKESMDIDDFGCVGFQRQHKREEKYTGFTPREYDRALIAEQLRVLRVQRNSGDVEEIMFGLRAELLRNLGNMSNLGRRLHAPVGGVPKLVREYINEVKTCLKLISNDSQIPVTEKLSFLQETRHVFGRTGLLLSGGGSLGTFHIGVCRALNRRNLLPRVLAGSSVGSIIAAVVCTRTSEELHDFFSDENFESALPDLTFFSGTDFLTSMFHLVKTGGMHNIDFFQKCLRDLYGDLTFQEAYDRSGGRILSVCVSPADARPGQKPRLLNYLTSPHLVIWSAVAASCAFPSLFPPQPLLAKARNGAFVPWQSSANEGGKGRKTQRWRDGSLQADLPMEALSQLFNVNYFIVSQTNPHIVPILRIKRWFASLHPTLSWIADFVESEWKHRCQQFLEFIPGADVLDVAKLFGQTWEGDVTVVMAYGWKHLRMIQSNPTREHLFDTATLGERETWPKLGAIENACGIEHTLDECVRELREMKMDRRNVATRGRVPSWNTLNYCSRGSFEHMLARKQSEALTANGSSYSSDIQHKHPSQRNGEKSRSRSRGRGTPGEQSDGNETGPGSPIVGDFLERFVPGVARRHSQRSSVNVSDEEEDEEREQEDAHQQTSSRKIKRVGSLIFDNCDPDEIEPRDIIESAMSLETLPFDEREKVLKSEAEKALRDFRKDKKQRRPKQQQHTNFVHTRQHQHQQHHQHHFSKIMSAWGNKTSTAKSWDDDDEEKLPDFPGLGDSFGPPPTSSTTSSSSQFPSLGEAQNTSKKKKGTKLSLAEFSGITSSVSAPITDDNVYRPSRGGSGGGSDHVDVYALPKAPNRERREEEESERRRPGELGGAFKDYGGDRGGGGGGGYGGGRDRDEDAGERGERYDRRGGERGERYDRRGGDRDESSRGGRRDDDRDFDEDGRERRREPEPSRADTGDWSKRAVLPEREERRGGFRDRGDGDRRYEDRGEDRRGGSEPREPLGPSRADTGDWSKRTSVREDDRYEPVRERPRLNLQKRSEGADKKAEAPAGSSSLFGGAKPVDVKYVEDAPRAPVPERRKSGEFERRERREPRKEEELREASAEELVNRPKLQLKKRETPVGESTSEGRSSLFGGARPREEALKASGKDWLEEDKRIEEAKLEEKKRLAELGDKKKNSSRGGGGGGSSRQISKEEQELKDKIAALKKENEGDDATDERAAEIDQLYEDLKKLRVSGRDSRPARKESNANKSSSSENNGKKQQPSSEKKPANVPDADGFISVKEAPAKKNNSERKDQNETTKPAGENGNGTANKKSNVFDLLGEDE